MELNDRTFETATPHELGRIANIIADNEKAITYLLDKRLSEDGVKDSIRLLPNRETYALDWNASFQKTKPEMSIFLKNLMAYFIVLSVLWYSALLSVLLGGETVTTPFITAAIVGSAIQIYGAVGFVVEVRRERRYRRVDAIFTERNTLQSGFAMTEKAVYFGGVRNDNREEAKRTKPWSYRIKYSTLKSSEVSEVGVNGGTDIRIYDSCGNRYLVRNVIVNNGMSATEVCDLINARVKEAKSVSL